MRKLHEVFPKYSQLFTKSFLSRIDNALAACLFRGFHQDMHLSVKSFLPRDMAPVIGCALQGCDVFPIKRTQSTDMILQKFFGTSSANMEIFFKPFAHLMPILCATKLSELQGVDTLGQLEGVIGELTSILKAIKSASVIVSMTTPDFESMDKLERECMNLIATLLVKTSHRLLELISLFETKRGSVLETQEKAQSKIGSVV
jgi:hypothetical protein